MKKVVCLVLNEFRNDSRVLKEGLSLVKAGYDVHIVALHKGDLSEREVVQGLNVHRIRLKTQELSKRLWVQAIKYLEWMCRIIRLYHDADVVHCNDLAPLPIAVLIKWLSRGRTRVLYDAHEYETETNGLRGFRKRLAKWVEKMFVHGADEVITVSDGIATEYQKLYGIEKPKLVLNCPTLQPVPKTNVFRETFGIKSDQKIVLYQGRVEKGRGLEPLLEAFQAIEREDVVFVVMGYGSLVKKVEEAAAQSANIFYHPAVPPDRLLGYTGAADIGISTIENACLSYYYCLPNKLFEFSMAGLPVMVSALPEMKALVSQFKSGIVIDGNSSEKVKQAIDQLLAADLAEMSANSRRVAEIYNWENQERVLLDIYQKLSS